MNVSKIIGVQFGLLSEEEIRRGSVVEITSKDTYSNGKPVPGGLFDIRMGVIDPDLICPTDGLDHMRCPGYFGHLELARPVFYIQYLGTILKILKCVCFKCSKLLINKTKHRDCMRMTCENRWKYVCQLTSKIKRCGEETDDGCGIKQPKIRKEELATIFGEWKNESEKGENINMMLSPEIVLRIFKRITDEDILFLGFHPIWARPESMICQVMAIPPPSMRPSVKHDLQQRCEDDLTHILVNIVKTNITLREKIHNSSSVADEWAKLLQYHFASFIDNRFPNNATVTQRSGRPLKSMKDRLNGKQGRIRGNLMAKRVNFSARSVITADPNISIRALGTPIAVAKKITKPEMVNDRNRDFLTLLVRNGADVYPGANILEYKVCASESGNKENVFLRNADLNRGLKAITLRYRKNREDIVLQNGDVVHRHLVNGDIVLFNRQPSLHKMSMQGHEVHIMEKGQTFRLNVAVTKPYNADFDGDEMNLHMPQDIQSEMELRCLAAVQNQIISPANNSPIIGIYQDSMLGIFQLTRANVSFSAREAMNLLMHFPHVNTDELARCLGDVSSKNLQNASVAVLKDVGDEKEEEEEEDAAAEEKKKDENQDGGAGKGAGAAGVESERSSSRRNKFLQERRRYHSTVIPKGRISSFELLSQIMSQHPLTMKYMVHYKIKKAAAAGATAQGSAEDIFEVRNGQYIRGQIDKSVLGSKTKGLIHRICNDYGNRSAADFIDNLQNIVTEYLKISTFSVGVSDLMMNNNLATRNQIWETLQVRSLEIRDLMDQIHLNVFENNSGRNTQEEFELKVNNILSKANNETQKIGLNALSADNRFRTMVNAGSKGSELNISQMITCVGQQTIDGKRVPCCYEDRTLPHFQKFDFSAESRGFIYNSYYSGLTPTEFFFHAQAGRVGLIDTAVKTSQTGYLQRRCIKGLEDLMVHYDMTIRSSKGKIVEFAYGDDSIDPVKVESQSLPLVSMSIEQIYAHFNIPKDTTEKFLVSNLIFDEAASKRFHKEEKEMLEKMREYTHRMIQKRNAIVQNIFHNKDESSVYAPVAIQNIVSTICGQMNIHAGSVVDITPLEAWGLIEKNMEKLMKLTIAPPTELFLVLYFFFLSPKDLLYIRRINRACLLVILETINLHYKRAIVAPGEMVGMIAAQSIGEPTTQMTLNTFHHTGISSKSNVSRGVPRVEEILSLTADIKNPSLTIYLKPEDEQDRIKAQSIMYMVEHTKLEDIVKVVEICFDPDDAKTLIQEDETLMVQFREFEKLMHLAATNDEKSFQELLMDLGSKTSDSMLVGKHDFEDEVEEQDLMGGGGGTVSVGPPSKKPMSKTKQKKEMEKISKWIIRMEMNEDAMLEKNISMDDVHFVLKNVYDNDISCVFTDYNTEKLVFRIRPHNFMRSTSSQIASIVHADPLNDNGFSASMTPKESKKALKTASSLNQLQMDQTDDIFMLKMFQEQMLQNVVLKGVKNIKKVMLRKVQDTVHENNGAFEKKGIWVIDTVGTNLMTVLGLDFVDARRTISNDIVEMHNIFGIEAAGRCIYDELVSVVEFDGAYVNSHHVNLLKDRMTHSGQLISICRHGINIDNIGCLAKASFEETPEMFCKAAKHGELDDMNGISANVMCGQEPMIGTNAFQLYLDSELHSEMIKHGMDATAEAASVGGVKKRSSRAGGEEDLEDVEEKMRKLTLESQTKEQKHARMERMIETAIQNDMSHLKPKPVGIDQTDNYDLDF